MAEYKAAILPFRRQNRAVIDSDPCYTIFERCACITVHAAQSKVSTAHVICEGYYSPAAAIYTKTYRVAYRLVGFFHYVSFTVRSTIAPYAFYKVWLTLFTALSRSGVQPNIRTYFLNFSETDFYAPLAIAIIAYGIHSGSNGKLHIEALCAWLYILKGKRYGMGILIVFWGPIKILLQLVWEFLYFKKFRQFYSNLISSFYIWLFRKVIIFYSHRKDIFIPILHSGSIRVYCYTQSTIAIFQSITQQHYAVFGGKRRDGGLYGRACLRRIGGFDRHGSGRGGKVVLAYFYCFRCPRRGHAALGRQLAALRRFCRRGRRWLRLQQIGFIQYHYARLLI